MFCSIAESLGRLIHSYATDGTNITVLTEHQYDRAGRLEQQSRQLRSTDGTYIVYSEEYTYRASDGAVTWVNNFGDYVSDYGYTYDALSRVATQYDYYLTRSYAYRDDGENTTTQVEELSYARSTSGANFTPFTLKYAYDALGNIAKVESEEFPAQNAEYEYDIQGQLTEAVVDGKTYTYTYDTYGNLRTAVEDGVTHTYTYGDGDWLDLLTSYDGETITYDEIGNPLSYFNGTRWTFDWENGRQLVSATDGTTSISYTYDLAGIRSSKTVGNVTYDYQTLDGKVVRQTWGSNTLDIIYDINGRPYALKYNHAYYLYVLNQQGDVIRIVKGDGTTVAEYQYDAWGNLLTAESDLTTIGQINPIRYRGYYYDSETGFYYCQSRYYDPSIGRWINADGYASTGQGFIGCNMFAYCNNDPVSFTDSSGLFAISLRENRMSNYDPQGAGAGGGVILIVVGVVEALEAALTSAISEIYDFSHSVADSSTGMYVDHQPRVHHVIPKGDFSRYGEDAVRKMKYMHDLLEDANIGINDPDNLVVLSQGSHKHLHTATYIDGIYNIMLWAEPRNEDSIRICLFFARIYAASQDRYPNGY